MAVKAIKYGMKGDEVSNLQTTLNKNGYKLDVDGSFGPQTLAAVKDYQQKNSLTVDGMVGPQTSAVLFGGSSSIAPTVSKPEIEDKPDAGSKENYTAPPAAVPGGGTKNAAGVSYPDMPTYDEYEATPYAPSETVQQAGAALDAILAAQPGAYQSKWQGQIDEIIGRILNREEFSYDVNEDALYKQYAEQYQRLGKLAMEDTTGQVATMTGGYGNSYAATAGNQAFQAYLSQLNEVVPELYGMALDKHNREGQEMYNRYGLLSDQEAQEYGRYMDGYNKWAAERDYASGRYDSERNFDHGKHVDDRNFDYGVHTDKENREFNEYLTKVGNMQWDANFEEGVRQHNEGMAFNEKQFAADEEQKKIQNGYTERELGMKEEAWEVEKSTIADSTKSYSGNGFNNGTLTNGQIKELQTILGVEADGKFGPKTKEAAGGLSANEAYAKYIGGTSETGTFKGLTASEAKGVSSQIAEFADNEDLEGAEAYLTYMVSNGYLTEEEAKSLLAPYVNVEEDEVVDTTVDTYTGSNKLPTLTTGTDYPILISAEQAGVFANGTLKPEELMKLWKEKGQFTGLTPEQWVKTLK